MLSEQTELNKHAIKLENNKKPFYGPIYNLEPVKLKTLKVFIKINLKTGLIWPSKSHADASILFDKKPDNSFWLYFDY